MAICPECGETLKKGVDDCEKHIISHWGVPSKDAHKLTNPEAQRRIKALAAECKKEGM